MKFLHSMIRVKDLQASMKFYTELIGLELTEEHRLDDGTLYFLTDKESGTQIELTDNDELPDFYQNGDAFGHFAFCCEDLEKFTEKLNSLGYKYLYEPFDLNGKGSKIAFIKDPDGNEIELIEKVVW